MDHSFMFMLKPYTLECVYVSDSIASVLGQPTVLGHRITELLADGEADFTIGATLRDQSAEEVIIAATELTSHPGVVGHPAVNWTGTQFPRTALLLDRFTANCDIIHCSNNAILSETCVGARGGFLKYVVARDIVSVKTFLMNLKQSGIKVDSPTNVGFAYHTFALCVAGRDFLALSGEIRVSAVGIASSDGIILVLKREP
ncbi:hypothetical protein RSAG8_13228, partial [Rhizoctonia solani AG-8 WAC10335]